MSTSTDRHHGPPGGLLFTPASAPFRLPRTRVPVPRPAPSRPGRVRVGPAGRTVAEIERDFGTAWRDAPWPARPWQVLAAADAGGVDLVTRAALLRLPARTYSGPREVAAVLSELPPAYLRRRD